MAFLLPAHSSSCLQRRKYSELSVSWCEAPCNLPKNQVGLRVTVERDLGVGRLLTGNATEMVFLAQRDLQRGWFLQVETGLAGMHDAAETC
jgi:hypothetical protein